MYSNCITPVRRGGRQPLSLVSSLPTLAKAALLGLTAIALVASGQRTASAANIVWVSDANDPATGFVPLGSSYTDSGFVTLLQNAGHNVIRYNQPNAQGTLLTAAEITALNTNDLIIVGRCVNSGAFQAGQGNQWNTNITKPLIDLSPYHVRTDAARLGWFAGATSDNFDDTPTVLNAVLTGNPATDAVVDYLFAAVAMKGTNTVSPYDEILDRNTSHIAGAPVAGGISYATANYVQQNNTATPPTMNFGYVVVGFPAGTAVRGGTDILAGYRMFFAAGSRESASSAFADIIPRYAGRETLTPTGESIFLRAVQVAINGGVAPATDPGAPIAFTTQPASATVARGGSVTFSVTVSGAAARILQWQRDIGDGMTFTNIPGASTPFSMSSITLPNVTAADDNAKFRVEASNPINSMVSDVATLTIAADTTAPVPLSAASLDGSSILVQFNELVDPRTTPEGGQTLEPFNYILTDAGGAGVSSVTLRPDGRSVILGVNATVSPTFSLNIALIEDLYGNAIDGAGVDVAGVNLGLVAADVGVLNPAGNSYALDSNTIVVGGGGLDIGPTSEQMRLVYKTVNGDFDAHVRVNSLTGTPDHLEATAKAMLCARTSTSDASPSVNVFVTPPYPADATYWATARTGSGLATSSNIVANPYYLNAVPASYPAWLRLVRVGDVFSTYRSSNGTDWTSLGSSINVAMGPAALVGLGVVSHRNGKLAFGNFSNFAITQAPNPPRITGLIFTAGTFSGSFQTQAGFNYVVRYKDDLNAATWQVLTTIPGDGSVKSFTDPGPASTQRFYSLLVQ